MLMSSGYSQRSGKFQVMEVPRPQQMDSEVVEENRPSTSWAAQSQGGAAEFQEWCSQKRELRAVSCRLDGGGIQRLDAHLERFIYPGI